jgi:gluconokinase
MLTAASQPLSEATLPSTPQRIVLMGVAGCGKSAVGAALAVRLGAAYLDGDDLHPTANIAKMSRGEPLTDDDRWPWLTLVGQSLANPDGVLILGCSALKRRYRDRIREVAAAPVAFAHLSGTKALIVARMNARSGHFMPTSLVDSQFAALEPPAGDEGAMTVDIDRPLEQIVDDIIKQLEETV